MHRCPQAIAPQEPELNALTKSQLCSNFISLQALEFVSRFVCYFSTRDERNKDCRNIVVFVL